MTAKPVTLRAVASRDIDEIVEHYLREAGSEVAFGFIDALEQACAHLAGHPATGSLHHAHELNLPGLRYWPLERYPYCIFYIDRVDFVDVWRVLHTRRDIPSWLAEPERN